MQALTKVAPGKKVLVYGEMLTFREAAALWGELQNVEVRFQQVELETWIKSLPIPSGFARELGEMYEYLDEFGYLGNDSTITDYTDVCSSLSILSSLLELLLIFSLYSLRFP